MRAPQRILHAFAGLDAVLAESDVVSVHMLLNDETHGFLNAERIAKIKPGALLVNTARAAIVDGRFEDFMHHTQLSWLQGDLPPR